jgi:DNA-binding transcriptional MerR regulator
MLDLDIGHLDVPGVGLLVEDRIDNGCRDYSMADIYCLRFPQRSRSLRFSVDECRQLPSIYHNKDRESADVKALAEARLAEIDKKIAGWSDCAVCFITSSNIAKATRGLTVRLSTN